MDLQESIKQELILRIRADIAQSDTWSKTKAEDFSKTLSNRIVGMQEFTKHVVDTLNDILQEKGVDFDDMIEKDRFVEAMKPTVSILMKEYLQG